MSASSDLSSALRKRALRRLSREKPAEYALIYEQLRPAEPSGAHARGKARTLLRRQYPDRYLELYAEEQADGAAGQIPAGIRTKSWQRATARLADLRPGDWREPYSQLRAQGMPEPRAWERAIAAIRGRHADLFARLLAEEYRLWLFAADPPDPPDPALTRVAAAAGVKGRR